MIINQQIVIIVLAHHKKCLAFFQWVKGWVLFCIVYQLNDCRKMGNCTLDISMCKWIFNFFKINSFK